MSKLFFNARSFALKGFFFFFALALAGTPLVALAVLQVVPVPAPSNIVAPANVPANITTGADLIKYVQSVLGWVFAFAVVIGTVMIIYAGIIYLTSAGSAEKVKSAVQIMIYAVVGIAITGFAWSLVNVLQSIIFSNNTGVV